MKEKDKSPKKKIEVRKRDTAIVRSSATEYLTFVASTGKGGVVPLRLPDKIRSHGKMIRRILIPFVKGQDPAGDRADFAPV